jgi:hypothetical protein
MAWVEGMVESRSTNTMEIKKIMGRLDCNISFDPTWKFIEDNHRDAYIAAFQYAISIIKPLHEKDISVVSKKEISFKDIKSQKVSKMFFAYFSYNLKIEDFENIENIIDPIYYSDNSDILIKSGEQLTITISSDPICIDVNYDSSRR